MEPKEKALELFGKYAMYLRANLMYDEEANEDAKQCALLAVDEIILEREVIYASIGIPVGKFWHEVRECIEAM